MTMTWIKRVTVGMLMVAVLAAAGQTVGAQSGTVARVGAYQTAAWSVWVSAGWHRVVVDGDGDTDLDLYVSDAFRVLAVDDDLTDYCIGRFYMAQGGYIDIRIANLGGVYNEYTLRIE